MKLLFSDYIKNVLYFTIIIVKSLSKNYKKKLNDFENYKITNFENIWMQTKNSAVKISFSGEFIDIRCFFVDYPSENKSKQSKCIC